MDPIDQRTHAFVIRIWLEEIDSATRQATWRGHVTHVLSGDRRYISQLADIVDFIATYLPEHTSFVHERRPIWRRRWRHS
jgi:hypothetical protein